MRTTYHGDRARPVALRSRFNDRRGRRTPSPEERRPSTALVNGSRCGKLSRNLSEECSSPVNTLRIGKGFMEGAVVTGKAAAEDVMKY